MKKNVKIIGLNKIKKLKEKKIKNKFFIKTKGNKNGSEDVMFFLLVNDKKKDRMIGKAYKRINKYHDEDL